MGWATGYIEALQRGETVSFRPRGNSMRPKIESGALCTVAPLNGESPKEGDIVLCKVAGNQYLHLVSAVRASPTGYQISNNRGHVNGWIGLRSIYGVLVKVEK